MIKNDFLLRKPRRLFYSIITAIIIVSFIAPILTTKAYALDVPVQIYPLNFANTTPDTDPPLGVPSFSWSTVMGANVFRLQVDSEIGFNYPIYMDITTRNITYTPQTGWQLFSDGEWFWRVRVEDPSPVGDWSPIFHFTKTWATPDHKPELLAPADGSLLAFFDAPTFSWTPVMGAASYRFQIALTPFGFDTPVMSVDTLATTYQPNGRLTNGLFYWRVVPVDTADHLGTPSIVWSFTTEYGRAFRNMIPTLVSPEDESFPTFTPTFHWLAIEGAEYYRLEYTSDETCNFSVGIGLITRQTFYTPTDPFPNDFRYCWRVRVQSGPAVGDWSPVWHFQKTWNLKPVLLTPTNLYQTTLYPLFSWTPVPGAAAYNIQIATDPYFNNIPESTTTANTTYSPRGVFGPGDFWWRVRPIDGGGKFGINSEVSQFTSIANSAAPILIYPLYYYEPNNYAGFPMEPYEDRTVAYPIFMWHRITNVPGGGIYAGAYRIQVADTPYFNAIIWDYVTENTSATPVPDDDFVPNPNSNYYWRVCPLSGISQPDCLVNPSTNLQWWSQIWTTQFSTTLELTPTVGIAPELLRPAIGQDSVEATPLLEWWPFEGATQYQVEVSRDANFSNSEITQTVDIPAYSPVISLVQRSLGHTDYGTFYWHVRGLTADGWSDWSDIWRFQIASQSEWRSTRTLGSQANKLDIGHDPASDASQFYDLTTLNASQSQDFWYFGFDAYTATIDMTYAFFIDLDNVDGSGASSPPERAYHVTTNPEHQPEYAVYIDVVGGVIDNHDAWVFAWDKFNHHWEFGQRFEAIGAHVAQFLGGYVELELPYAAIGMNEDTSSASVMLFSVNNSNGELQDTVPSNIIVPENTILTRFSAVSEHMNLIFPPSTATGDPTSITSILPFYWDWPTGDNGATPFAGFVYEVYVDQDYTPPAKAILEISTNTSYYSINHATLTNDIVGDNIYYWRVRPRYMFEGYPPAYGAWTGGWSFNRNGFKAQNLTTSVTFATPTFSWDMVEGAAVYLLQVATDPNFGNSVISIVTAMNSYTPPDTLAQDLYYWRVQVIRSGNIGNDWSEVEQFNLSLPTPTGLAPDNGLIIHTTPTYCWDPLVGYANNEPVLTAWRYFVQVSTDPNFSSTYDSFDVFNNCWTPFTGYYDGTYFWRVAMIDGSGRMGSFSPSATFTKQYPITTLISPISEPVQGTPTFIWTPVDGAATYSFEVSWYPTFYPLYDSIETVNIRYTPTSIYQSEKVYYWRVAIRDRTGKPGPYTDATIIIGNRFPVFLPLVRR